jgi:hypothetical protein
VEHRIWYLQAKADMNDGVLGWKINTRRQLTADNERKAKKTLEKRTAVMERFQKESETVTNRYSQSGDGTGLDYL